MYKILVDNILMYDSRIEELALINPVVNLEENKAGSFSFKIPPNHPYYDLIQRRKSIVQVFQDDEEEPIFSGMCIEITNDFYKQKEIYCEGELSYFNDSVQRQAKYQNVTVRGLLENFIAKHNEQVEEEKRFKTGIVTVEDSNDSLYCFTNMESTMKCLKEDLVEDLGGFFRIRHVDGIKYLDYLAGSQNTNSQIIKLGKNLLDFTSNMDSSEIATAIIPLGAMLEEEVVEGLEKRLTIESVNDGKDYVFSQEAVDSFGWVYSVVTWDDVTTAEILKNKGEKYLSEIQFENMVIEAKAVDLHLDNSEIERFKLSDEIRVVSKPHGLDKYFRLTKMTINLNNPEKNTITLGKEEKASLSEKTNKENEEIKNAIKEISPSTILNSAIENATQLIKNSMNGYITTTTDENGVPTELLIMDTPDKETATKVWRWNINGLGYSENGYHGEYALAMTMDGSIVADRITTGTMFADRIRGGVLSVGGFDNLNGTIRIFDKDSVNTGVIDNNGIALWSSNGVQIILSPLTGLVQRDSEGNEFYGLIYDEIVGGFSQYSKKKYDLRYYGRDNDNLRTTEEEKTEEYWAIEPSEYTPSGLKSERHYKRFTHWYEHSSASFYSSVRSVYSDYEEITIQLPSSFKGKQWVIRFEQADFDFTGIEESGMYYYFDYTDTLPKCYETGKITGGWLPYYDIMDRDFGVGLMGSLTKDDSVISQLQARAATTPYLKFPEVTSGEVAINFTKEEMEKLKDQITTVYSWSYDEENATVTIKAKAMYGNINLNEFMRFRVYAVC